MGGVEVAPGRWLSGRQGQMRRSCFQPDLKPLVGGFEACPQLFSDCQFHAAAASAHHQSSGEHEQFIAAGDCFGVTAAPSEHSREDAPEVVSNQQETGRAFTHDGFTGTKAAKAPLVFEFVKDVFAVSSITVELDNLGGVGFFGREVGDVGVHDFLAFDPEVILGTGVEGFEGAADNDPSFGAPALDFEADFGVLLKSVGGVFVPLGPGDTLDGAFDVFGELELEEEVGTMGVFLFVPGHDFFLPKADVATVEFDAVLSLGAGPDFFHRFLPGGGADGVAFSPGHVQGEAGATNNADQRVVAGPTGLVRVVADGDVFLMAVAGGDGGVPVGDAVLREGVVEKVFAAAHPSASLFGGELRAEAAEGVFTAEAFAA